jgi:hypothetical protein
MLAQLLEIILNLISYLLANNFLDTVVLMLKMEFNGKLKVLVEHKERLTQQSRFMQMIKEL